jgi:hypothetical protein
LGHQAALHFIYAFHGEGSAGGHCHFPITHGTLMEKTQNKNLRKRRDSALHMHLFSFDQQGASQFGEPPLEAGITANLSNLT